MLESCGITQQNSPPDQTCILKIDQNSISILLCHWLLWSVKKKVWLSVVWYNVYWPLSRFHSYLEKFYKKKGSQVWGGKGVWEVGTKSQVKHFFYWRLPLETLDKGQTSIISLLEPPGRLLERPKCRWRCIECGSLDTSQDIKVCLGYLYLRQDLDLTQDDDLCKYVKKIVEIREKKEAGK